jgi:alpha-ketoglutaric semialdehyde dehydrogenase
MSASTVDTPTRPAPANYIAGEWRPSASGETYEKRNPARPDEVVGSFPRSDEADADAAIAAAETAFPDWSRKPGPQRAAVLTAAAEAIERRVEPMAVDMTREMGKPLREARLEARRGAAILRYFAGEALRPVGELYEQSLTGGVVYTVRRPLGVVGLITPWNFPAAIPLWKLSPALVFGNTVVLKAAMEAPLTALHIAESLAEAGLPAGVLNLVIGPGSTVGSAIVRDLRIRAISFTGSVPVGRQVREEAMRMGKRVQLELGGQNPLIVLVDADLDRAVEAAYAGAFWSAGQKCTATRRIFVQEDVYGDFRGRFLERIERGTVGDPADPEVEVGPIVNESQLEDVLAAVERGRSEGGNVIAGGERVDGEGYLLAPTVFEDVRDDATLSREEVFGPVTSLYRFSTLEEALRRANAVEYGLSASIFTSDLGSVHRFVRELDAGILHVNSQTAGAEAHVPFGGIKGSGYGPHEQGRAALEFYTEAVTVYQDA